MDDLYQQAEDCLMALTEKICEIHGQYRGIYLILYWILEWCADKLIWRQRMKRENHGINSVCWVCGGSHFDFECPHRLKGE